jgi:SAM-dependent methyltransferase
LPPDAFDDLIRVAGLGPGSRVLEIGCGTGQATVPMAERGLAITAVELGTSLAAVARRRLADFPSCHVVTSSFEDWQPAAGERFDAVAAFNSLHWVEPSLRYAKPHALLGDAGTMVVAGCRWAQPADKDRFWTDVQEDYRAVGFEGEPPPPPEQIGPRHFPAEAEDYFNEVASFRYPFQLDYSAADYLAQLATQSGTRALGEAGSADFLARVRRRLEALGSPHLTATFVGTVRVGRRRDEPAAPSDP